jgi:DDE superfamily endonuclease/Helix-turn-helix of DDE superfamily endonuclease
MLRLCFETLRKHPSNLQRLSGLSKAQFSAISAKARVVWDKEIVSPKKVSGRPWALGTLENHILALMVYYRFYVPHTFLGLLFGVDDSVISRSFKRIEPILEKIMSIKKERRLSQIELETIIVDVTEQTTQRPQKKQKVYYSGKKKRHTLKTEIQVRMSGEIVRVSKPHPGSVHDFEIRKREKPISRSVRIYADSGYQGIEEVHPTSCIPFKRTKLKKLTSFQKRFNTALSRRRVKVENVICRMKKYKILQDRYRNKREKYHMKTNIIAGLVNLKYGF